VPPNKRSWPPSTTILVGAGAVGGFGLGMLLAIAWGILRDMRRPPSRREPGIAGALNMAKRIVFHIASLRGGGAERVFVLMANELASRGHDVTLFTWNAEGPNAALRSPAVKLINLSFAIHGEGYSKADTLKGVGAGSARAQAARSRRGLQRFPNSLIC
jgi:hypothetical protein